MKHEQYSYKGYDITIEESQFGFDALIFKNKVFRMGWRSLETFENAKAEAKEFIDNLQGE